MIPASSPPPPEIAAAFGGARARVPSVTLDLQWYPTVTSTMDLCADAAAGGAPEGLVICADEQTSGRGRRGRVWSSPAGSGLYLSIVLRPTHVGDDRRVLSLITLAAGVAVHESIDRATGFGPQLKWPNDVVVGRRKLAGILAEGHGLGTSDQAVILGIGVNVSRAAYPQETARRATSIEAESGRRVDRARLLEELLVTVFDRYDRLRRGEADDILRAWREISPTARGARVESADGRRGVTAGLDADGALLVETSRGVERVIAGELRWL